MQEQNNDFMGEIVGEVHGWNFGRKKEFTFPLTLRDMKHIRRCIRLYDFLHPPSGEVKGNSDKLTANFKLFGKRRRRNTKAKKAFKDYPDRPYKCEAEGCTETKHLTIDHIVPLRVGGTWQKSNMRWLCKKHHNIENLKYRITLKEEEIKTLKEQLKTIS